MFAALGRLAARRPWFIIAGWIVLTAVVVAFQPKTESTTDQADFLPKHYESIKATELMSKAFPAKQDIGATIVFDRADDGVLSDQDIAKIQEISGGLDLGTAFSSAEEPITAPQKLAVIVNLNLAEGVTGQDPADYEQIETLREDLNEATEGTDLRTGVTGNLAQSFDQSESGSSAEALVGIATIVLIILLLSLIFRSGPVTALPIYVIAVFLSPVATGLVAFATKWFGMQYDASTNVMMIVVLFGVGTDYVLFFLFRYRERIREGKDHHHSVEYAVERAGEAIFSAGGAVFVAFMTLLFSSLGMFRGIGPTLAIGVAVTMVGALTLVPAVVSVVGPRILWPSQEWKTIPVVPSTAKPVWQTVSKVAFIILFLPFVILSAIIGGLIRLVGWPISKIRGERAPKDEEKSGYAALGRSVGKRPAPWAIASGAALVLCSIFALNFTPLFNIDESSSSQAVESVVTQKRMEEKGFTAGATQPTIVVLHSTDGSPLTEDELQEFGTALEDIPGATLVEGQGGAPAVIVSPDEPTTAIASLLLDSDPSSDAAIAEVKNVVRPAIHDAAPEGTEAYVGGLTSVFVDFKAAMERDYKVVFPIAAGITLLILMLVLRSLVAPWYLMVSVGLGFTATLGATTLVFQNIKGDDGLLFMLPIMIYLFVVALGTDYNILMVTRLREEAREGKEPREAASWAIRHAGPTIAAAGVILAGTFASLMLAGNAFMTTMGFAISFGIVIAAFVMALVFTPALTAIIGHAAWWPGHGDEPRADEDPQTEKELVEV